LPTLHCHYCLCAASSLDERLMEAARDLPGANGSTMGRVRYWFPLFCQLGNGRLVIAFTLSLDDVIVVSTFVTGLAAMKYYHFGFIPWYEWDSSQKLMLLNFTIISRLFNVVIISRLLLRKR
jgi:ABC-type spermidine/putrescine transport system permease subunit II